MLCLRSPFRRLPSSCLLVLLPAAIAWGATTSLEPVEIGTQKQLFLDDQLIAATDGVFRVVNQPVKHPNNPLIALEPPQQVNGRELVIVTGNVMHDSDEQLFKMWYEAADYRWSHNYVGYATSKDGIHWELPRLDVIDHPLGYTNLVFENRHGEVAPGVCKDPRDPDPQRRYKMIYDNGSDVGIAFSPNGIHWQPVEGKRVADEADSPHAVAWDPRRRKYVAHTRHNAEQVDVENSERQVLQSESDDFLEWVPRGVIVKADEHDPLESRQFYNMPWMPYGDAYVGFLSVYHVHRSREMQEPKYLGEDRLDTQLTSSRDGTDWTRVGERATFLPTGHSPRDVDFGMIYVMQHPLVVGDEIWIYYTGFAGRHWFLHRDEIQGGTVCLARLRLDGFVSMDSGEPGTLTTVPLVMRGDQLIVNADASQGAIRVEILDVDGKPVAGFGDDDALPVTGNSVRQQVRWSGQQSLRSLQGNPLLLRFHLRNSKLYSFTFQ